MIRTLSWVSVAWAACYGGVVQGAPPLTVDGRVVSVTVYQGQALVTREVDLAGAEGLAEVVVSNLPEHLLPGSLFAEPSGDFKIRSVRYRERPIEEDVRQEVRELDDQIQQVEDQLAANQRQRQLMQERRRYLDELEKFSATTSQAELKSGVLNAGTLKELTQFLFDQRQEIAETELDLDRGQREAVVQRDLLQRKRQTVAASSARTAREAVVFVDLPAAGGSMRLSYLVDHAHWSPSYNLRASDRRDQVTVEYNASIQQLSGEDWTDVEMVLSTATPSLVSGAPRLEPLSIKLGQPVPAAVPLAAAESYLQIRRSLKELEELRGGAQGGRAFGVAAASREAAGQLAAPQTEDLRRTADGPGNAPAGVGGWEFPTEQSAAADKRLNVAARQLQLFDLNNSLSELKAAQKKMVAARDEGVSVSYRVATKTSLPSRADRQLIQIAALPLKGDFYKLATPVLTSFVYEEARLINDSDYVLLAGPAATFLGGQFVGRGDLPTVAVGESFAVGLGIDSSLRAERKLVDKQERIEGGNRVVDFAYQLTLQNFGAAPTKVRLLDRLPTVGQDDIKVTLLNSDQPVSDDPAYQAAERKDGILRWDVEVPAQTIGPKQFVLKYTMQIEYDKQLSIIGMEATP